MSKSSRIQTFGYSKFVPTFALRGEVFSVPLAAHDAIDIEHLKSAIRARTQQQVLAIYRGSQASSTIEPADARIEANPADTPYRFIVVEF